MSLTITLEPEVEARYREEAAREGLPVEIMAARRLLEAELLTRILGYLPDSETRELRALVRKREAEGLSEAEQVRLTSLAHTREVRNAERLEDLLTLANLRSVSLREIMAQLRIRPHRMS